MEKALKKRDKLLEESEKKAKCLEEEYEYLDLRISSGGGGGGGGYSHMKRSGILDVSRKSVNQGFCSHVTNSS